MRNRHAEWKKEVAERENLQSTVFRDLRYTKAISVPRNAVNSVHIAQKTAKPRPPDVKPAILVSFLNRCFPVFQASFPVP